jgi:ABC-type dipeptide/oligopeptide/nickel transport system permease component
LLIPTLLGVYTVLFIFLYTLPGSPAIAVTAGFGNREAIAQAQEALGLNDPLHVQYLRYLGRLVQGDLGDSFRTRRPVIGELMAALPATLELTLSAVAVSVVIGAPLGVLSALRRGSLFDHVVRVLVLLGWAVPSFLLGLVLIIIFALNFGWFPTSGRGDLRNLVLPMVTLAVVSMASITRMTRASMLDVLGEQYVVTARAKGLRERTVIYLHAAKNAMLPVVTVIGYQLGVLLTSAILIETVFAWPGVGRLLVTAIQQRDFPLIQGTVLFMGTLFLLINLMVDISYAFLDPRIRYSA